MAVDVGPAFLLRFFLEDTRQRIEQTNTVHIGLDRLGNYHPPYPIRRQL